ncbi:NADH-quinone oxidoreductase subunit A [Hyperthermus butylicus]|uniref:Uncharacterized protein n=1 Tax=Hyperthermus butylicus (strain DSM 5456 / JCM 9403 / PLM1-5) TaxID=415426 RepID=A2BJ93_HYPBU|nr:NADH-quinone oxidoreductase subunit A [Hyperthermus butylicus]ABM80054.1 hypothetical protein Hbut_0182 [Hyperthermus butylicus DSM 5456]
MDYAAFTALLLTGIVLPVVMYFVYRVFEIVTRGPDRYFARFRYESGNPPKGLAWARVLYHYFGYVVLLVALEPIFIILYVFAVYSGASTWELLALSLAIIASIIPPLRYAVRYAEKREYWELEV